MSSQVEFNKIMELNSHGPNGLAGYTIPENIYKPGLFESLISHVNNAPMTPVNGNGKNFKMEHYYPLLEWIVNEMNKIYFAQVPDANTIARLDAILSNQLLTKLTLLIKGQTLLNKLAHRIPKVTTQNKTIVNLLMESARTGPFLTFLFWLNRHPEKAVEKLPRSELEQIFISSIGNSDDRLFKFVLEKVLKADKLFFQKNTSTINSMLSTLANSLVPAKYQLKRIKILSGYISLVPYFHQMINSFNSDKVVIELHKYYYVNPHTFDTLRSLLIIFVTNDWAADGVNVINEENYNKIVPLFKTEEELYILNILLSIQYDIHKLDKFRKSTVIKIVQDHYNQIIEMIEWGNLGKSDDIVNFVVSCMVDQNLINKYIESHNIRYVNNAMLFYTRFLKVPAPASNNKGSYQNDGLLKAIKINKLLHNLRLWVKTKCKTRVIQHKVKMFDLLREISTFTPKSSVPVLARGSTQYQCQKQKFTNLPPRHLLPGEISIYKNFMLKEKADGVLISNMPVGIYPQADILNNYQVKAEYIEELDLYLVFDVDIPNTTIEERYSALRKVHPYTSNTHVQKINALGDFIKLFNEERAVINRFINDNKSEPIKWYPKFSCVYDSKETKIHKIHQELICNIILEQDEKIKETIANSEPFKCDGLILTPLDGSREIKIKPKSMMTIDLLFDGKKWIDRNCYDWSNLIIKPKTAKKEGRIYRCYPNETFDKFTVGEFRFDKKKSNPYNIVDNIVTMCQYDWSRDVNQSETYYYDTAKKITSESLIKTINAQVENLSNQIIMMQPEINKSWLDLGCGKGKLIPIIKKYNPKNYLGLDVDVKQLIKGIRYHDENQDVYVFAPCNLAGNWSDTPVKWHNINRSIKYDYVVANFSLMHFCTDEFWTQLGEITHEDTKFIFNVVCPPSNMDSWSESESYLKVEGNQTVYKFEWAHNEEKIEPFITDEQLSCIITKHGWKVQEKRNISSKHKLINFYKWWIITKC